MLTFISGNHLKIELAQRYLDKYNISFLHRKLDILEPQFDSIEDIAEYKVQNAYEELKTECFITDVGWEIPALDGFPGPYMAYVVRRLSAQDWLNLIKGKEDKSIIVKVCLVYTDGTLIKNFTSKTKGRFLQKISSCNAVFELDRVISFRENGKSAARCREDGETMSGSGNKHWDKFCKWYAENRT